MAPHKSSFAQAPLLMAVALSSRQYRGAPKHVVFSNLKTICAYHAIWNWTALENYDGSNCSH